jgi:two-component system invasion response regulator UvrY
LAAGPLGAEMTAAIRVLLADDHAMIRQGLASILEESPGILVVGQAGNGPQALKMTIEKNPDVVVLDYSMPLIDGPALIEQVLEKRPQVKILVLTVHENFHYAVKALEAGAHGFLIKAAAAEELIEGIQRVHSGRVYISQVISEKMLENLRFTRGDRSGLRSLSRREFQLLRYLGTGKRLQECARLMKISESAVCTYRSRLMEKLGLNSTPELIRYALENEG